MKHLILSAILLSTGLSLTSGTAIAQTVVLERKGNVTIVQPPYDETAALANIETAAGEESQYGVTAPAVTIVNVPHQPAFNPLTGQWVSDGPVFGEKDEPLSLRDRVRGQMKN